MMKKRGISPIVATVLLIAFTVVLAALVMNWQGKFVQKVQDSVSSGVGKELDCLSDVDISASIDDNGALVVENNKDTTISEIIVREYTIDGSITVRTKDSIDGDGNLLTELGLEIGPYGSKTYTTFTINRNVVTKVEVIPVVKTEGGGLKNCDAQSDTYIIS